MMKTLKNNIVNSHGVRGRQWLESLPATVEKLSQQWSLTNLHPVHNMTWHYVAKGLQHATVPIILKISCDLELIQNEYQALSHFAGHGAIEVLDFDSHRHALLLAQAIPGDLLNKYHSTQFEKIIKIYANIVKQLGHHQKPSQHSFIHVHDWLTVIDDLSEDVVEKRFIHKAKALRDKVSDAPIDDYLCHGDLHLDNVIHQGSSWVAIDPKGIMGNMAFEAAACDIINPTEIVQHKTHVHAIIEKRVTLLAEALSLDVNDLIAWIFLRIMISVQWFIEDNGDPSDKLLLAEHVYPFISSADAPSRGQAVGGGVGGGGADRALEGK